MNLFDKILDLIALPIRKLWRVAAHGAPQEQFRVIFTIAVLMVVLSYFTVYGEIIYIGCDDATFLVAAENIAKGELDVYRTPVYPIICKICLVLGQDYGLWLIVLAQTVVFLVSVIVMHKACCLLAPCSPLTRFIAEAFYSCNYAVCLWVFNIYSESLSFSCIVFLAYLIIKLLRGQANWKHCISIALLYLIMLFLKPYFICLAPAILIVIIMIWRKSTYTTRLVCICGIVLNIGAYTLYCHQFEKKYGIFATTCIGVHNMYWQTGRLTTISFDNKKNTDPRIKGIWLSADSITPTLKQCKVIIGNNVNRYLYALFFEFVYSSDYCLPHHNTIYMHAKYVTIYPVIPLKLWGWLTFIFMIWHLWRWRKRNSDVRVHAIFAIMAISGVFTAIAGSSFSDYSRLTMPVYPILCLMIAAPGNFREEE